MRNKIADLILYGGDIITVDEANHVVAAIAVKDGKIAAVSAISRLPC